MSRILLVDLNNFARFPTLPVGILVALLRREGHDVRVLSPLAVGMTSLPRGMRAKPWGYLDERIRWWSATTPSSSVRRLRRWAGGRRAPSAGGAESRVLSEFERELSTGADIVLVSTYLMYETTVRALAAQCLGRGVPLVVGGPAFTDRETQRSWLDLPGLSALMSGEVEPILSDLVRRVVARESLDGLSGVATPAGGAVVPADPLQNLDAIPYPDYADFPWDAYPGKVVSMMAGRGCGWGACSFCSDVLSANGRGFRSRSAEHVLGEIAHHRERHGVDLFCFSDLKLNGDLSVWRGLHAGFQEASPGAKWTCAVHVGAKGDQGLSRTDLDAARQAGLVRITTGVESGSQRVLDSMRKGTKVGATESFLEDAASAGISVRTTMFTGFPGETAEDVHASAELLERQYGALERVSLSRFVILPGTAVAREIEAHPAAFPEIETRSPRADESWVEHVDARYRTSEYRAALRRLLKATHRINRKPLMEAARPLEGAM